ncbi:gluconate 2-dehydrogenase subunit 3 family protein, partial [Sphingobacterium siyangense]|uniref:gluconate 2-dehydrogenase subunit 3 family protein n=3 Tax=Sphingobacteriaceae TaxID=84566 RepID=UPI003C793C47
MNRRKAIKHVALLIGGSIVGTNLFLEGCVRSTNKKIAILFEKDSINLLNELGEAILPRTSTPGAKDANVGSFIPVMIRDCYSEVNQKAFVDGLGEIDRRSKLEFGKKFLELTSDERFSFVDILDQEAKDFQDKRKEQLKLDEKELAKELV